MRDTVTGSQQGATWPGRGCLDRLMVGETSAVLDAQINEVHGYNSDNCFSHRIGKQRINRCECDKRRVGWRE